MPKEANGLDQGETDVEGRRREGGGEGDEGPQASKMTREWFSTSESTASYS